MLIGLQILLMIAVTVYLLRKKVNIGIVMLLDSLYIVLVRQMNFNITKEAVMRGALSPKTIGLIIILYLIMMLEMIMRKKGMISDITESLKHLLKSNRMTAAVLPVVIGMLPSPGGARLSCPMVEEVAGEEAEGGVKAFVNYWFRHVWLDGFILYPGVIIGAELMGVASIQFFLHLVPFMLLAVLLGILFGSLHIKKENIEVDANRKDSLKKLLSAFFPIAFLIIFYIVLLVFKLTEHALETACLITVVMLIIWKQYHLRQVWALMKEALSFKFILIIIGVMVFREVLSASGLLGRLPEVTEQYHISKFVLFMILPFIAGFTSGIMVSAVSMAFPLLIPLGLADNTWYGAIAMVSAAIGIMISPLHLCSVMTADYFKVSVNKVLLRTMAAEGFMLLALIATVFLVG